MQPATRRALTTLQRMQHGVVARYQLDGLGISRRTVDGLRAGGTWDTPRPAVYRDVAAPRTPRQRLWVAVLWAGERATLSHGTAAMLWGLDGFDRPAFRPEVWVANPRAPRGAGVVVHRTLVLPDEDRACIDGLPVTSPERTIIDVAGVVSDAVLEAAFESARRRDLITVASLAVRAAELCRRGRRGGTRVWRVLRRADHDDRAVESVLEVRALRILRRAGLPEPRAQHEVRVAGRTFRLDLAWPREKVAVECQGWTFHRGRGSFDRDQTRTALLVAAGWRVVPTTWTQLGSEPDLFVRAVESVLSEARATGRR